MRSNVIATPAPEVAAMYLALSAMYLMDRHRLRETDRHADMLAAHRRQLELDARPSGDESTEVVAVPLGDRPGRVGHLGADVRWVKDLHPASRGEQPARRLVRPVQSNPEP